MENESRSHGQQPVAVSKRMAHSPLLPELMQFVALLLSLTRPHGEFHCTFFAILHRPPTLALMFIY
jgi:hypothetical protein